MHLAASDGVEGAGPPSGWGAFTQFRPLLDPDGISCICSDGGKCLSLTTTRADVDFAGAVPAPALGSA